MHVASSPPWAYGPPGNLFAPTEKVTFDGYVQRLSRFSREGILDMGARVLWFPWQRGDAPTWSDVGFSITETFGPDVVGFAMMYCPEVGIEAEEVDFRLLCWELFALGSFAPAGSPEDLFELETISSRWLDLLRGTPFEQLDVANVAPHVRGLWRRGRLLTSETALGLSIGDDVLRIVIIHEELEKGAHDLSRFRHLRNVYFRNEVIQLLQHGLALIHQVPTETGAGTPCPGRFDVHAADEHDSDVIDFAQFGSLACLGASEFTMLGRGLATLPHHERKLHPDSRPLARRPGVLLDDRHDFRAFFYPSPRRLVRSFQRLFVDDFIEFLAQQDGFEHAPSLLGQALHEHLRDVVGGHALLIDDSDCPVKGKKPDAVWCGDRFGVVIEAKGRLTPRTDPECTSPGSLLEAWRRAWEAVEQADSFLGDSRTGPWLLKQTGRAPPSVWVLVVLVGENDVAERTSFRHATARWNLLSGTALSGVGVSSFGGMESALRTQSPDAFGRSLELAWRESGVDGLGQPPEEATFPPVARPSYLEKALERLVRVSK
jgi:hypothetical protein